MEDQVLQGYDPQCDWDLQWDDKHVSSGLGTSTPKEAKEYFADIALHQIPFQFEEGISDDRIELAFSKDRVNDRKQWLSSFKVLAKTCFFQLAIADLACRFSLGPMWTTVSMP